VRESTFWAVFFDFVTIFGEKSTNQAALCPNWRKVLALWGVEIPLFVQARNPKNFQTPKISGTQKIFKHQEFSGSAKNFKCQKFFGT
jgi:hypothetical protein